MCRLRTVYDFGVTVIDRAMLKASLAELGPA
jgi:hypothetical protein